MVTIRPLLPSDVAEVFAHGSAEPAFTFEGGVFWTKENLERWFSSDDGVCIGAFEAEELVGFVLVAIHRPTGKATWENVYVAKAKRRAGIASDLEREAIRILADKGVERVQLLADADRPELRELYERLGYDHFGSYSWYSKKLP